MSTSDANSMMQQTLNTAMRSEIQRVLMERPLDLEQFERLEQMLAGAKQFLVGSAPKELVIPAMAGPLDALAQQIRDARFKALGFTTRLPSLDTERDYVEATEALIRSAAVHGVCDMDDEEIEVEEIGVRVDPLIEREVWMPIRLVDKIIFVLADSDGDVADHLIDIVNDCRSRHAVVEPDAVLPIDVNLITLIAAGLADPQVLEKHPDAKELAAEVSACVLKVANGEAINGG